MPLPIPDILQNASTALVAAKKLCDSPVGGDIDPLREALKRIHPDDLLAVLNEVGKVYQGLHQMVITRVGSRPAPDGNHLEIAIGVNFGLGERMMVTGLPPDAAEAFMKQLSSDMIALSVKKPGGAARIISNAGEI